jgi:hypothetical protein
LVIGVRFHHLNPRIILGNRKIPRSIMRYRGELLKVQFWPGVV